MAFELPNAVASDVMAEIEHPKLNNKERVYASIDAGRPVLKYDSNRSGVARNKAWSHF